MNNTFVREIFRFLLLTIGFWAIPILTGLIIFNIIIPLEKLPLAAVFLLFLFPLLHGIVGLIFSMMPKKSEIYFLLPQVFFAVVLSNWLLNFTSPSLSGKSFFVSTQFGFFWGLFGIIGALGGYFILWQRAQKEKQISVNPK